MGSGGREFEGRAAVMRAAGLLLAMVRAARGHASHGDRARRKGRALRVLVVMLVGKAGGKVPAGRAVRRAARARPVRTAGGRFCGMETAVIARRRSRRGNPRGPCPVLAPRLPLRPSADTRRFWW